MRFNWSNRSDTIEIRKFNRLQYYKERKKGDTIQRNPKPFWTKKLHPKEKVHCRETNKQYRNAVLSCGTKCKCLVIGQCETLTLATIRWNYLRSNYWMLLVREIHTFFMNPFRVFCCCCCCCWLLKYSHSTQCLVNDSIFVITKPNTIRNFQFLIFRVAFFVAILYNLIFHKTKFEKQIEIWRCFHKII